MPTQTQVDEINAAAEERARRANTPEVQRLQAQLIAAQQRAALNARARPGELVEVIETDRTGRRISKFVGDPAACWSPFKLPLRIVTGFKTT